MFAPFETDFKLGIQMQLIKWIIIFVILGMVAIIALPFMFLSFWVNEYDTKKFLDSTSAAFGRKCAIDLKKGK